MIGSSWGSYPKIANLGHSMIRDLLTYEVNVEEKVDGSQFSFGMFEYQICLRCQTPTDAMTCPACGSCSTGTTQELRFRSKGAVIHPEAPPAMFQPAVETVQRLHEASLLEPNWTYRGETLCKPKHNTLVYDQVPPGHIILFDVNTAEETYLHYRDKEVEAARLGLAVVPLLHTGYLHNIEDFRRFLDTESILGGQKIEGVVVKPRHYNYFGLDKKVLMGKFVSEAFREIHSKSWRETNPTRGDVVEKLIEELSTPARYQKAVIHLRERGVITDSVKDIGAIIAEVRRDIALEAREHIAQALYRYFADTIIRRAASGVPQWWKDELVKEQFEHATPPRFVDLVTLDPEVTQGLEKGTWQGFIPGPIPEAVWQDIGRPADDVIPQADGDSTPIV
jgi:hypothetical protein